MKPSRTSIRGGFLYRQWEYSGKNRYKADKLEVDKTDCDLFLPTLIKGICFTHILGMLKRNVYNIKQIFYTIRWRLGKFYDNYGTNQNLMYKTEYKFGGIGTSAWKIPAKLQLKNAKGEIYRG